MVDLFSESKSLTAVRLQFLQKHSIYGRKRYAYQLYHFKRVWERFINPKTSINRPRSVYQCKFSGENSNFPGIVENFYAENDFKSLTQAAQLLPGLKSTIRRTLKSLGRKPYKPRIVQKISQENILKRSTFSLWILNHPEVFDQTILFTE